MRALSTETVYLFLVGVAIAAVIFTVLTGGKWKHYVWILFLTTMGWIRLRYYANERGGALEVSWWLGRDFIRALHGFLLRHPFGFLGVGVGMFGLSLLMYRGADRIYENVLWDHDGPNGAEAYPILNRIAVLTPLLLGVLFLAAGIFACYRAFR